MAAPLIQLTDIALTFGGNSLLNGVDLAVGAGERICLVGRNGSGKSTLLKIAAGIIDPDRGTRFVQPGALVRYLPQEPDLSAYPTTLAYVEAGLSASDDPHQARYLLEQLGLTGNEDPAHLSGGEARRAALAHVLAPDPQILLLDEPTNHLDLPAIEWLETRLQQSRAALVIISHDRRFLEKLSRTTVWLDRGQARRVELPFSGFETWRDQELADEETRQHKLDRKIVAEEHWVHGGVTGRRKRNVRRMAELRKLRQARRDYRAVQGKATLSVAEADASSTLVIEAKGISKSFGDQVIVRDLSLRLMRGDRLGIVGPNGSGKTTLVSLLTGLLPPDAGEIRLGASLEMASLDQGRESLDPNWTLSEALTRGRGDTVSIGGEKKHVIAYMKDFLFAPEQRRTPISALSGGERGRLMLARALATPSNLLVLDEPTNDLDLETLDVLEDVLADYKGTVILISHDRDFLDRVVTSVIVPEGDGRWTEYAGGYQDMLAQRGQDLKKREARAKPAVSAAPAEPQKTTDSAPQAAKKRLSFKDKHALETLPGEIAALEAKQVDLTRKLEAPDLYTRDRKTFTELSDALAQVQEKLAAAEERWLELEILRGEIEGA
ncbi:ABC-F family ATP-binding cassette domain-containing protein [Hyphomicrobium sp. DMF-1]|jgi:ATP-binding cassette subfamily F protein uup|uniref:ABC-F family ATP-binding cassette domain-containing protein n=1 Tax=Hyphomicrobium sp. DMF-1 TaxID=3019544 RepID=UPI0022EBE3DE|nr:ATP-binding cassette domain-containing protein [Hyphomicrobium sp. DMF-1]WBT36617.1 ATP-binding cassette domain-containing protein [Hyphomicrobium sp. DMF-1]